MSTWDIGPDAASSEDDNLPWATGEVVVARADADFGALVYPSDAPEHRSCEVWGVYRVITDAAGEWWPEILPGYTGMTLDKAQAVAEGCGSRVLS